MDSLRAEVRLQRRRRLRYKLGTFVFAISTAAILFAGDRCSAQLVDSLSSAETPQVISEEDSWVQVKVDGRRIRRRTMILTPAPESKPALAIQLIPDDYQIKDGNAAVYYLKAMAYAEQTFARQAIEKYEREQREAAQAKNEPDAAPYSWLETPPQQLPLEEMENFLRFSTFQEDLFKQAHARRECDFDRRIREVSNPIMYLLPEVQQMRQLGRFQSMRCRYALANNDVDRAIEIVGQQLAMGRHMAQDNFIVSALVGIAIANMGLNDAYYLPVNAESPNLYWAYAALPTPLADLKGSLALERNFLFEQIKGLRKVDDKPRPAEWYSELLDELSDSLIGLVEMGQFPKALSPKMTLSLAISSGYPGARAYLSDVVGMSDDVLDQMCETQVFLLGCRRHYEQSRDEIFKLQHLPYHVARSFDADKLLGEDQEKYGFVTVFSNLLLPAIQQVSAAGSRTEQQVNLLRTVESLRHHLATSGGKFPASLKELALFAPNDPATGNPFEYTSTGDQATLRGAAFPGYQVELILKTK